MEFEKIVSLPKLAIHRESERVHVRSYLYSCHFEGAWFMKTYIMKCSMHICICCSFSPHRPPPFITLHRYTVIFLFIRGFSTTHTHRLILLRRNATCLCLSSIILLVEGVHGVHKLLGVDYLLFILFPFLQTVHAGQSIFAVCLLSYVNVTV
jgi:hypothetical protein